MPLRIIYVDDEAELCEMVKDNFESNDVIIETFTDPELAVRAIERNPPDLLFLDYRMPGRTGDQIAKALDPAIPKVLITGDLGVRPTAQFIKIFLKPFCFEELSGLIQTYSALKRTG